VSLRSVHVRTYIPSQNISDNDLLVKLRSLKERRGLPIKELAHNLVPTPPLSSLLGIQGDHPR
jgi:hypothetical protein